MTVRLKSNKRKGASLGFASLANAAVVVVVVVVVFIVVVVFLLHLLLEHDDFGFIVPCREAIFKKTTYGVEN